MPFCRSVKKTSQKRDSSRHAFGSRLRLTTVVQNAVKENGDCFVSVKQKRLLATTARSSHWEAMLLPFMAVAISLISLCFWGKYRRGSFYPFEIRDCFAFGSQRPFGVGMRLLRRQKDIASLQLQIGAAITSVLYVTSSKWPFLTVVASDWKERGNRFYDFGR